MSGAASLCGVLRPAVRAGVGGALRGESAGVTRVFDFSGGTMPPGATLTRATTGTYFGADGLMHTAAIDEPRFDHVWNGSNWELAGLLVEPERVNICPYGDDLQSWNLAPGGVIVEGRDDKGGAATAFGVEDNSDTVQSVASLSPSISTIAGDRWWCQAFAKQIPAKETDQVFFGGRFIGGGSAPWWSIYYTCSSKAIVGVSGAPDYWDVRELDDGWLHLLLGHTAENPHTNCSIHLAPSHGGGGNLSKVGETVFWRIGLEKGEFPTSPIPTSGGLAARSADVLMLELEEGNWGLEITAASNTYLAQAVVDSGNAHEFVWPSSAVSVAERHLLSVAAVAT